mmetsp:Transcript_914/g.955  ORF Transcript_914/g.955 Transcript_914/m.955 type:complete len:100 (+) Transcript_914:1150-1449(+)
MSTFERISVATKVKIFQIPHLIEYVELEQQLLSFVRKLAVHLSKVKNINAQDIYEISFLIIRRNCISLEGIFKDIQSYDNILYCESFEYYVLLEKSWSI